VWVAEAAGGWRAWSWFVRRTGGCRTLDLCKVKTADLAGDTLTLTAEVTKTREARTVPLPAEIVAELRRLAGPEWLWERSVEESKLHRPTRRKRAATRYYPSTWRWTVQNLFREFTRGRPGKSWLRPHDLRARTITLAATATKYVDATAQTMGVDPQTARHYLDAGKVFDRTDILKKVAGLLLPQ